MLPAREYNGLMTRQFLLACHPSSHPNQEYSFNLRLVVTSNRTNEAIAMTFRISFHISYIE